MKKVVMLLVVTVTLVLSGCAEDIRKGARVDIEKKLENQDFDVKEFKPYIMKVNKDNLKGESAVIKDFQNAVYTYYEEVGKIQDTFKDDVSDYVKSMDAIREDSTLSVNQKYNAYISNRDKIDKAIKTAWDSQREKYGLIQNVLTTYKTNVPEEVVTIVNDFDNLSEDGLDMYIKYNNYLDGYIKYLIYYHDTVEEYRMFGDMERVKKDADELYGEYIIKYEEEVGKQGNFLDTVYDLNGK